MSSVASLKRKQDQFAWIDYFLTGEVICGKGEKPEVGSMCHWVVPDESPPIEDDENVFHALGSVKIWEEIRDHGIQNSKFKIISTIKFDFFIVCL